MLHRSNNLFSLSFVLRKSERDDRFLIARLFFLIEWKSLIGFLMVLKNGDNSAERIRQYYLLLIVNCSLN
jgi:hypothetical protein